MEVGAGRAGEGLCMVGMPRAGGCSQVCLRWGTGLAQAQPLRWQADTDRAFPSQFWSVGTSQKTDVVLYHPWMPTPRCDQRCGHHQPQAGPFALHRHKLIHPGPTLTPLVCLQM